MINNSERPLLDYPSPPPSNPQSSAAPPPPASQPLPLRSSPFVSFDGHISTFSSASFTATSAPEAAALPPPPPVARHGSRATEYSSSSQKEISGEGGGDDGDDARVVHVNGDPTAISAGRSSPFADNSIRTTKYSVVTFLPRNLFEQFHRLAYVYFLAIAVLNQLPQLAVFGRGASILPLAFVLLVTAFKDAYEDFRRHRSDRLENNRTSLVLQVPTTPHSTSSSRYPSSRSHHHRSHYYFHPKRWKEIRVGDVVKVLSDETLPCDMVLLATSDPTGVAYVQTINLDGESNLKTRYAKQETMTVLGGANFPTGWFIRCERPNRNIYGFHANMDIDGKRVSLGPANIVLRGCQLKNTAWAVGVAVYAGRETKAMLNNSGAPSKRSSLENHMNRETLLLSAVLITLCSVVTVCAGIWLGNHKDELDYSPYFRKKESVVGDDEKEKNYNYYGIALEVFFAFLKSVIVFQIMIPISLYISMELVRLGQAYFMVRDRDLYDEASNSRFQCRALNINEDLGQIKYVFSDKTGTLTENKMEFQCASVRGVDYSGGKPPLPADIGGVHSVIVGDQFWRPKMTVKTDPELVRLLRSGKEAEEETKRARLFFLSLAACNTIVPLVVETVDPTQKLIDYQGESPDEQALVYAAAAYGFVLVERTSGHIVIDVLGDRLRYDVLGLHEFDSDRKRMSVIVGCPDKTVKLFVKGADSSMFGVIDKSLDLDVVNATETHLHKYSSVGLRTLVIGMRELSSLEFGEWQSAYERASTALIGRGGLLRAVATNIECNLQLLGASGIEDKLQQGVPEAIESLRQAGIKVWVLTGDKQETAISIGYSCKLLSSDMTQIIINSRNKESCRKSLEDANATSRKLKAISPSEQHSGFGTGSTGIPLALIIDGTSLVYILETELEEELFKVATACDVVLCCRVAPLQKAGIVALIKNRTDDMTLAIGDGANDVSMIQMADVGIGISGQEGRQAVMASDFAMGQFRFLVPLLLVHGHWNYQRMAYMILYNFYRNAVFVFILFWYVLYTAFSLTTAITEWSSVLYSVIYTALPTIIVGILDKDLSRKTLLKFPQLYGSGQREERYNLKLFILTMMDTIWQSAAIFFIPYLAYRHSTVDASSIGDLWTLAVVIIVNIHLAMDVFRWNWMTHASIWGCIVATVICVIIIDAIPILPGYWTQPKSCPRRAKMQQPPSAAAQQASESREEDAPPKQVAMAMERLTHAARLIADIRFGADRLLEALFMAADAPHYSIKTVQLILKEESSMLQHFQDLRNLGRQLEESGVLNGSLKSRGNSWGLHMPLVCPDGAVVAYAWKRQLAGQAGASAVDRTRLALKAFTDQKRRFFPHLEDEPFGHASEVESGASKKHCTPQGQAMGHGDMIREQRPLSEILTNLEHDVPDVKIYTYQRLDWLKRASSLSSLSIDYSSDSSKEQGLHSSTKPRSGSGNAPSAGNAPADQAAVIELLVPSVFRAVVSLHPAGSISPDAVAFFSPDEGGNYIHSRGLSVYHVFKHITQHADKALQYFLSGDSNNALSLLLHWMCSYQTLFTKVCSKCRRLLMMEKSLALILPPVQCPYQQPSATKYDPNHLSSSAKGLSQDQTLAYHISCSLEESY